jgi:hypothetical protein
MCGAATANRWSSRTMNADILSFNSYFHQTREKMTFPWRESVRVASLWNSRRRLLRDFWNLIWSRFGRENSEIEFYLMPSVEKKFRQLAICRYDVMLEYKRGIQSISSRLNESESAIELLRFLESFYQWAIVNVIFFYFW